MGSILTQGFTLPNRQSGGGVNTIYLAAYANIGTPNIVSGSLANTTNFFVTGSGGQFFNYVAVKYTADMSDTATVSVPNNSAYYEQELQLNLYGLSQKIRNEFILLAQNSVIAIVQDDNLANPNYWLIGSDKGLDLSAGKATTGKAAGDLNGYQLTFKGAERYPHVAVSGSFIAALTTPY